jgi:hypothetical protein
MVEILPKQTSSHKIFGHICNFRKPAQRKQAPKAGRPDEFVKKSSEM